MQHRIMRIFYNVTKVAIRRKLTKKKKKEKKSSRLYQRILRVAEEKTVVQHPLEIRHNYQVPRLRSLGKITRLH